ncbi:MAG: MATE family efflux transporter [Clostridium fessum]
MSERKRWRRSAEAHRCLRTCWLAFVGLSSGATVIIAQFYGAGRGQRVSEAVHTAIAFSLLCGILMTVGGLLFSDTALRLMGTPEDIMDNASGYLHIYFVGITANLLYNMGAGILRAIGDSKRPFYFLVISCFTNIALDLLFVVGLRMGVRGAAVATILSLSGQRVSGIGNADACGWLIPV